MNPNPAEDHNALQNSSRQSRKRLLSKRSSASVMRSFVRFVNRTVRRVDVIWLNYEGSRVKYITLLPEQFFDVNTFVGHPWIFRDSESGDKLVVQLQEVFEPETWSRNERKMVNITIPVYSLKERCLQIVRSLVPVKRINKLDIPDTLKVELKNGDDRYDEDQEELRLSS